LKGATSSSLDVTGRTDTKSGRRYSMSGRSICNDCKSAYWCSSAFVENFGQSVTIVKQCQDFVPDDNIERRNKKNEISKKIVKENE
jgi:hypothetical protein